MSPGGRDAERHLCRGTAVEETSVTLQSIVARSLAPGDRGIDYWCQLVRARLAG